MNVFMYNNLTKVLELNEPEILLIKEFNDLYKRDKSKSKDRAWAEFTYIYLAIDWKSPYNQYTEQEKHEEALNDSGLTEEKFNDPIFRAACRKYRALQDETRSIKLLKSAQNVIDKFVDYFNNIDVEERDEQTGKPVYKTKNVMDEISSLHKVHEELVILESQVKKEISETSSIRAGAVDGYHPNM